MWRTATRASGSRSLLCPELECIRTRLGKHTIAQHTNNRLENVENEERCPENDKGGNDNEHHTSGTILLPLALALQIVSRFRLNFPLKLFSNLHCSCIRLPLRCSQYLCGHLAARLLLSGVAVITYLQEGFTNAPPYEGHYPCWDFCHFSISVTFSVPFSNIYFRRRFRMIRQRIFLVDTVMIYRSGYF